MSYFSKIENQLVFRKTLLSTAKNAVLLQKKEEIADEFRQKKKVLVKQLEEDMKYLGEKVKVIESLLTNNELKKKIDSEASKVAVKETVKKETKEPVKEEPKTNDVDRLEYTLSKIEQKLKNL